MLELRTLKESVGRQKRKSKRSLADRSTEAVVLRYLNLRLVDTMLPIIPRIVAHILRRKLSQPLQSAAASAQGLFNASATSSGATMAQPRRTVKTITFGDVKETVWERSDFPKSKIQTILAKVR
jgi:hypothetical protein